MRVRWLEMTKATVAQTDQRAKFHVSLLQPGAAVGRYLLEAVGLGKAQRLQTEITFNASNFYCLQGVGHMLQEQVSKRGIPPTSC